MRNTVSILLLGCLALVRPVLGAETEKAADYTVVVAPGETCSKSVTSLGGSVRVAGEVKESVLMVGGRLDVQGKVGKDIITIGTQVTLADGAVIEHDLIVIGGGLSKGDRVRIGGEVMFVSRKEDLRDLASTLLPFLPESGGKSLLKGIKITLWLIVSLLVLTLFPRVVPEATELFRRHPLRIAGIGLASLFLFLVLTIVSVVLSFFLIGVPMLLLTLSGYLVVLVLGRTVLYCFVGQQALSRLLRHRVSLLASLLGGIACYALIKFLPLGGPFLLLGLDLFTLGTGVGYLLRRRLFPSL